MVGLMATSSKRAYAIPWSAAPRAPAPAGGHYWPMPLQETLRHSSGSVSGLRMCFCVLPRSEQLRWPGAWRVHCHRWAMHLNHLLGLSCSVSLVPRESTISGVLISGKLISGCDPPGRCQTARLSGRHGSSWEPAHSLEDAFSGAEIAATPCLPALAVTSLLLSREGLVHSQLALLWSMQRNRGKQ